MKRLFFMVLGLGLFFCALSSAAQAQATRTWVSGLGDDANPCSRTAPCKTFPGAYSRTAAGGEIDVIDPGGFGTISISKAITIDGGGGVMASILSAGTVGVTVNAGANDQVTLRNLWINGVSQYISPGTNGIVFNSGRTLNIEHCVLENFTTNAVQFQPVNSSEMNITDTTIENAGNDGVKVSTTAGAGGVNRVQIMNTWIHGSGLHGVEGGPNSRISIYRSMLSKNGQAGSNGDGVDADGAGGGNLNINVDNSQIVSNGKDGLNAINAGQIRVSDSTMSDNIGFGVNNNANSGFIYTGGNNRNANNILGPGSYTGPIPLS